MPNHSAALGACCQVEGAFLGDHRFEARTFAGADPLLHQLSVQHRLHALGPVVVHQGLYVLVSGLFFGGIFWLKFKDVYTLKVL